MPEEEQKVEKEYLHKLMQIMTKLRSLNKSEDFLKILKKKKLDTRYFTIYFDKNFINLNNNISKYLNISFVMKKKIGNAVTRNKIKRRLKSIVQKILKDKDVINLSYGYVVFGKNSVYKSSFKNIFDETSKTFKKINNYI